MFKVFSHASSFLSSQGFASFGSVYCLLVRLLANFFAHFIFAIHF
jgi:hypothetical protein